jgi:hypothetical protein
MVSVMSTLRSGVDELVGQDLASLSDSELEDRMGEIERACGALAVERARTVAEVERRGSFERDGHLSVTSWVESKLGTSSSQAAREVRLARGWSTCRR